MILQDNILMSTGQIFDVLPHSTSYDHLHTYLWLTNFASHEELTGSPIRSLSIV